MTTTTTHIRKPAAVQNARLVLLAAGPIASWTLFEAKFAEGLAATAPLAALVLVALWSPLYFSVPALLCQSERDRLLPAGSGPFASMRRGLNLIPVMLKAESGIKLETIVSLTSFAILTLVSSPTLVTAVGMLF